MKTLKARPKSVGVMLINGGSIRLNPRQKWDATFYGGMKEKVRLERGNLTLIMGKDAFLEEFTICAG